MFGESGQLMLPEQDALFEIIRFFPWIGLVDIQPFDENPLKLEYFMLTFKNHLKGYMREGENYFISSNVWKGNLRGSQNIPLTTE